ncbi:MAG: protein kinase [Planctomycetes bacterium]|nr:protein kinase [Planctomycetota bacterium]
MPGSATGWSADTRPEDAGPPDRPERQATRADASAAKSGLPLTALQQLAQKFEILGELGRGGMGVVYRARDREAGREVALKLLLSAPSPTRLRRFEQEGATAARLRHRGIVVVHSAGQVAGQPYLVCELVEEARTLDEAAVGLPLLEKVRLLRDVVEAIGYAHGEGVIHRDLKPANVIVDAQGTPRVTDFGLARHEGDDRLTQTGASIGTPTHMAPEQARGEREKIGPPADVWSLGIMFHELVCGTAPFMDGSLTPIAAFLKIQAEAPPSLRKRGAQVSPALDAIARRALMHDPADRYPDARAMCRDLDAVLGGGTLRRSSRKPWALLLALLAATVVGYASTGVWGSGHLAPQSPPPSSQTAPAEAGVSEAAPTPEIPAGEFLAQLHAEPDAYRRTVAAWDWLSATPRAHGNRRVRTFVAASQRPLRTVALSKVTGLGFLADGRLIAMSRDGKGFVWDLARDRVEPLPALTSGCSRLALSPDRESYAVMGNLKINVHVFGLAPRRVQIPRKAGGIALSDRGELLVGHMDGRIEVFAPGSDLAQFALQAHDTRVFVLKSLRSGKFLTASRRRQATSSEASHDTLRLWSQEAKLLWNLRIGRRADGLSLDRAERVLLVSHAGGLLSVFDLGDQTGPEYLEGSKVKDSLVGALLAHDGRITSAHVDPWGQHVYSTSTMADKLGITQLRTWSLSDRRLVETREEPGQIVAVDLSQDGRWIAAVIHGNGPSRIDVWSALPPR